jgi:hypothetical protein
MEISALRPYTASFGQNTTPTIGVECNQTGKRRSFIILLYTGSLESYRVDSAFTRLPYDERLLRTKVDADKPRWRSWRQLTDGKTYEYVGMGETGAGVYSPSRFLKDMFSAQRVLVEFQPYEWNGDFTAEFEMRGLSEEFEKHQECKSK